jgi:hypothetical protein
MQIKKPHWPLLIVAAILLAIIALQLALSLRQNERHFVYALDDPYIHMAIARNFARNGVWGVTRYEFSSSTSSLLWTLILSAFYFFTSSAYVPLILNIACGLGALVVAHIFLQQSELGNFTRLMLLLALALLTPLTPLIFSGMEHTAQIISTLALTYISASVIADDQFTFSKTSTRVLLLLAAVVPLVRYEGLFLVGVVAAFLILRRRYTTAALILVLAVVPLSLYGLYSWMHGSFFFPNPVLLKGSIPRAGVLPSFENAGRAFLSAPHLLFLWLLAIWLFLAGRTEKSFWRRDSVLLLIFILTTTLHILFARVGWFFRYEAYLVAMGIMIDGAALIEFVSRRRKEATGKLLPAAVAVLLAVVSATFLVIRGTKAINETVPAMKNIYEQHYQMATFLREYYQGVAVAANDIGAINFYADIRCVDLLGLGSAEVTRAKLAGQYNTARIDQLAQAHQVKIALIYSGWFDNEGGVPPRWIKVGEWNIKNCVVCGAPVVSFYGLDPVEAEKLKRNLREFSRRLPKGVVQSGPYYDSNE